MDDSRVEQFKREVAELKVATAPGRAEQVLLVLGVILMIAGILVGLGGYISTTNLGNTLDQNEMIVLGFAGVAMAITGAALFLRYSLAKFFRFWLLRQIYENQSRDERHS